VLIHSPTPNPKDHHVLEILLKICLPGPLPPLIQPPASWLRYMPGPRPGPSLVLTAQSCKECLNERIILGSEWKWLDSESFSCHSDPPASGTLA
jgi:hypothetical protein